MKRFRVTSVLALAVAMVALLAISGCGSSDDDSGTTAADTASTESTESASPGVEVATEEIEKYSEVPTDIGVSEPLSKTPEGARVVFLESSAPAGKQLADAAEDALGSMGAELTRIAAGHTPETVTKAWSQVFADPPDAVIEGGFPVQLMIPALEKMKELGVPVVTAYSEEAPGLTLPVVATPQYEATGNALANFVVSKSGGEAKALLVDNRDIPGLIPQTEFLEKTYAKNCPTCEIESIEVPLDGIGRTIPGEVVSYLQTNPDTDWIIFNTPEFAAGVPQAIKAAGLDGVDAVTQAENPLAFEYIKNEELLEATFGISLEFTAWRLVDTAVRAIVGDAIPKSAAMPSQFLFADDMTFDISKPWPSVPDYKEQFEVLWGVK